MQNPIIKYRVLKQISLAGEIIAVGELIESSKLSQENLDIFLNAGAIQDVNESPDAIVVSADKDKVIAEQAEQIKRLTAENAKLQGKQTTTAKAKSPPKNPPSTEEGGG